MRGEVEHTGYDTGPVHARACLAMPYIALCPKTDKPE